MKMGVRGWGRARRAWARMTGWGRRQLRRTWSAPTYSDAELLARLEEFNRNAEAYWREIAADPAGRAHALNKPLSTVADTASILYRFGLVLAELDLGVGHTVLDFGAGSCWLSSSLNRLRCRTISVDVSPTALRLGQELFALDPRHHMELEPRFVPFDGHRIPLEAESVDRIVCFDAFHHIPNQDEILGELFRVLRRGGRAVFAEPGEGHAHTHQSEFETQKTGVLENDLDLELLLPKLRAAGFDDISFKPYPNPEGLRLSGDDYLRLIDGHAHVFPMEALQRSLRHFYIFTLGKGRPVFDSRNPRRLRASIRCAQASLAGPAGAHRPLPLAIDNAGDTRWLHEVTPVGGYVGVGGHLLSERREIVSRGYARGPLPRDVAPGESVNLVLDVPLPSRVGRYTLQLDLVDEWITWFEQCGSPTTEVEVVVDSYPDSRAPLQLRAEIQLKAPANLRCKPGARQALPVRLTNQGSTLWLHAPAGEPGTVSLGGHLVDAEGRELRDVVRCPLPGPVAPGESVEVELVFAAPSTMGRHSLRLDLVDEGVCWFENHGSPVTVIAVETTSETPDSSEPGLLSATLELEGVPAELALERGGGAELSVRVTNTGNTLWLHAERAGGGHVALGGHLKDERGGLLALDLFRGRLPRDVGPGEQVVAVARFQAPREPGRYLVELDMVDEGLCWFASRGSRTVTLALDVR